MVDASAGRLLDEALLKVARALEMEYFACKNVYTKVPRQEAFTRAG